MDDANPTSTVRAYYEALRNGEPLTPYFADEDSVVKVGISERLVGYDAVAEGLDRQTRRTDEWTVRSRDLRVTRSDGFARFDDEVDVEWRDTEAEETRAFDTRWSGTLADRGGWRFLGVHVSAPTEF